MAYSSKLWLVSSSFLMGLSSEVGEVSAISFKMGMLYFIENHFRKSLISCLLILPIGFKSPELQSYLA